MPVITELQMKMTEARQSGDHFESMLEKNFVKNFYNFVTKNYGYKLTITKNKNKFFSFSFFL